MKLLHVLAAGGRLFFTSWPAPWPTIIDARECEIHFHPTTARKIVEAGWVKMIALTHDPRYQGGKFDSEYTISATGLVAVKELCKHDHWQYDRLTVLFEGKLVCMKCWRALRCASRQPTAHEANGWHDKYGPICNACWRFLYSRQQKK